MRNGAGGTTSARRRRLALLLQKCSHAAGESARKIHLVDFGFDQNLAGRNVQLLEKLENSLIFLARGLNQERVVERIGNDARDATVGLAKVLKSEKGSRQIGGGGS